MEWNIFIRVAGEDEVDLEAAAAELAALHTPTPGEYAKAKAFEAQRKALAYSHSSAYRGSTTTSLPERTGRQPP